MIKTSPASLQTRPHRPRRQQGFTLVEIMVALTIGLLMMAGILQITLANKESSRLQRNMGFVQENIRNAMEFLARDVRMAGHYIDNNPAGRILTPPAPFINVSAATTVTTAPLTADGGTNNNDQITLTRESNFDCLGQATPADANGNNFAINHYFIANQRLMCRGNGSAAAQPLVEGVESLQILYGENTDNDPRSANRYVRPEQVANMANVVSLRIGMRFISREAVRQAAGTNQYALLDATPFIPAANDRLLRREITTTVSLRNDS
ncbi:MAG: PilW family protein [Gammaproteobacteria bacterium]|nr:PilW family protein [Gammaproteobacteria bacterium]